MVWKQQWSLEMRGLKAIGIAAVLACLVAIPSAVRAQTHYAVDDVPTVTLSEASYSDIMSRLEMLESSVGTLEDDGWTDTHDQKWSTKWGGQLQGDYVLFANERPAGDYENYFEMRRMRLYTSGSGYGVFDYRLQVDLEEDEGGDGIQMKDAYMGIHQVPLLGYVRFGNFWAPFSLEQLTDPEHITFMERGLPNVFVPSREVGVCAYNHTENENFTWAYGLFFDDIDESSREAERDQMGTLFAARGTWTPTYDSSGRYMTHFGVGYLYRWVNEDSLPLRFDSYPEIHEAADAFVTTGVLAGVDEYSVVGLEGAVVRGPFSLQMEYMGCKTDAVNLHGIYLYGSWFITGESRGETYNRTKGTFDRIKPLENFWFVNTPDGRSIGTGAWEAKARWSYLDFNETPNSEQLNNLTVGVNWYWNPYMRCMFDFIHPLGQGTDRREMDIAAMRMQVDF